MSFRSTHIKSIAVLALLLFLASDGACLEVEVTVHAGEDHSFEGFGVGHSFWRDPYQLSDQAQDAIDQIVEAVYSPDGMNFSFLRLQSCWREEHIGEVIDAAAIGGRYARIYQQIRTFRPDLKFIWNPWDLDSVQNDLPRYVDRLVTIAADMKETFGFDWYATGVFQEPNNDPALVDDSHIGELVELFRVKLNERGMSEVKIIAPECRNVLDWNPPGDKGGHTAMIDSIIADPQANAATDIWGYHSYDYGATKWFRDQLRPTYKPIWQTEGGMVGQEGGVREVHYAVQQAATILSDINLLASSWFFLRDFDVELLPYDSVSLYPKEAGNLFMITNRPGQGVKIKSYLKTDFIRRLSRSFTPGTGIRFCTSDLQPWTRDDLDRFTYMENTNRDISGEKSQICAGAGLRGMNSWVLATVNRTGLPGVHLDTVFNTDGTVAWMKHTYAPAETCEVTFVVPELESAGHVAFEVTRCDSANRCYQDGFVSMFDGRVSVTNYPAELVTLECGETTHLPPPTVPVAKSAASIVPAFVEIRSVAAGWEFTIANLLDCGYVPQAAIYDGGGRRVATVSFVDPRANHLVARWDGITAGGRPAAAGIYRLYISNGSQSISASLIAVE